MRYTRIFLMYASVCVVAADVPLARHMVERNSLLQLESDTYIGGNIVLSEEEDLADQIIAKLKLRDLDKHFTRPDLFNFTNFLDYRSQVMKSQLFQIIRRMPKGVVLHIHDSAMLGHDYLLGLTYLDDLYMCTEGDSISFLFSNATSSELKYRSPCATSWKLVKRVRETSKNRQQFDADLIAHFTMNVDVGQDQNAIWRRFEGLFSATDGLIHFRPVWERYVWDTLEEALSDGVMYMEIRSSFPELYELDGTYGDTLKTANLYKTIVDEFTRRHPDFLGARIIYSVSRNRNDSMLAENLEMYRRLRRQMGEFVVGFDLVGQEDKGRSLKEMLPLLVAAKDEVPFFFHAGETNWSGTETDENLVDAVLLGSRRLGHAYALLKHPGVAELVRQKGIGLEMNVISNQVLGLVGDVRNHPLAALLAMDAPVVLSSDDPGLWGAKLLSHDYYVALVGVASRHAGLRMLKRLALNSLQYSALQQPHLQRAEELFHDAWSRFIRQLLKYYRININS